MRTLLCATVILGGLALSACQPEPAEPKQEAMERKATDSDARGALEHFKAQDPSLQNLLNTSVGYAIFPEVGKGGVIVGGAHGRGEVYDNHGTLIGYATISQATVGAQVGAQTISELIVFNTKDALNRFKGGDLEFAANASAVAIKSNSAASSRPDEGMTVFVQSRGGLMVEAAIGGQKFRFEPL